MHPGVLNRHRCFRNYSHEDLIESELEIEIRDPMVNAKQATFSRAKAAARRAADLREVL